MTGTASFRRESEKLVGPALERLRHGDPQVVAFLYFHYDYLHTDVQRQVFRALWQQLSRTQDQALAARLHNAGINDLATDFPQLAGTIRRWSDRLWTEAAGELTHPLPGNIHAESARAAALRNLVVGLPLSSICGAKLRKSMAALLVRWPAAKVFSDAIVAWRRAALKRPKSRNKER